ncbi:MAG: TIGR03905 family TSCPD domain-containing protein [Alphaproteobacteria bacterium]|nr:TIGR03905 family TSCPD domain-containing protein [Alphaproteobacteria bacterium]
MKKFNYTTQGVCSTNISFNIDDGRIYNVKFDGGCMGNLQAISKLVEGKSAEEIADILRGNDCRGKGTSCADQLAKAIDEALIINKKVA